MFLLQDGMGRAARKGEAGMTAGRPLQAFATTMIPSPPPPLWLLLRSGRHTPFTHSACCQNQKSRCGKSVLTASERGCGTRTQPGDMLLHPLALGSRRGTWNVEHGKGIVSRTLCVPGTQCKRVEQSLGRQHCMCQLLTLILPGQELLAPRERGLAEDGIGHAGRTQRFPSHEAHPGQVVQLHLQEQQQKE